MTAALGLYIHIPFCESKCDYCNFASGVYPEAMVLPYLKALKKEILGTKTLLKGLGIDSQVLSCQIDTIYLGGGTPSLIDGQHVKSVLSLTSEVFTLAPETEITLEVNPGSVNPAKVEKHLEAGVNRISIGMQTFQDRLLKRIGRSHSVADSFSTLKLYREMGMSNVSLDLIAGLPGQTIEDWQENLRTVEELSPDHISMYMLEIHENTRFGKLYCNLESSSDPWMSAAQAELPDEDMVEQFYMQAIRHFERAGYHQYEISNFARPGRESKHNLKYWTDQPFLGFGCGAHSYLNGTRWGNERSVGRYIDLIERDHHAIAFRSHLSPLERQEEAVFLGMRLTQGISLKQFESRFGFNLQGRFKQQIAYLEDAGLVESTSSHLRLTPRGWMLSNEVFVELLQS